LLAQQVVPDPSSTKTIQGTTNGFVTYDSDTDTNPLAKKLLQSKGALVASVGGLLSCPWSIGTHEIKFEFARNSAAKAGSERVFVRAITLKNAADTTGVWSKMV
jgi:hypothetical protein